MREGDPTGQTGPTPMMLAMIECGGEDFWVAANWPLFFIRPMLDDMLVHPSSSFAPKKRRGFKKLVATNPVAAWQIELDDMRVAYNRWCEPGTLSEFYLQSNEPLVQNLAYALIEGGTFMQDIPEVS